MSSGTTIGNMRFEHYKLVLLGESAVGKSSIVNRLIRNDFDEFKESTIGAAFLTKSFKIKKPNRRADGEEGSDEVLVKFDIWDTAGQERYKSLAPMYYRNAQCALVVYDISSEKSWFKAKKWVAELRRQTSFKANLTNMVIALVGNKTDLPESIRQVSTHDAFEYSREENLLFFEVSAKSGQGITQVFEQVSQVLSNIYGNELNKNSGSRGGGIDLMSANNSGSNVTNSAMCSC